MKSSPRVRKKEEYTMENILRRKRPIPEYYDPMYLDGYEPWEIMEAVHKKMRRMIAEREAEDNSVSEVKITSVIKKR
jgi:ribulose kinase